MTAPRVSHFVTILTRWRAATVAVEIAATPPEIKRGLMYREYLAPDAGMLFLMGYEDVWAFYMRNTLIPLDILFITRDLRVAGIIHSADPCTETRRQIAAPSLYVLEVNGGWAAAHQVAVGDCAMINSYG